IKVFNEALKYRPNFAKAFFNIGNVYQENHHYQDAVKAYTKALEIDSNYADAHINMGNTLGKMGKFEQQVAEFEKALALRPDNATAHNNMGNALKKLGKITQAVDAYEHAITISPSYAEAYYNLGNSLIILGNFQQAAQAYLDALKYKPDFLSAAKNLVKLPAGNINKKMLTDIDKKLATILASDFDESERLFFEANLLSHKGDWGEAFKFLVDANRCKARKVYALAQNFQNNYDLAKNRITKWQCRPFKQRESSVKKLFIVGPSRSGKSTLEEVLATSRNVLPMFENIKFDNISGTPVDNEIFVNDFTHYNEEDLIKLHYDVITVTSPECMFHADSLINRMDNCFFILVKRDPTSIAAEIFAKEYTNANYFAYDNETIKKYLDTYFAIWQIVQNKAPKHTLEIRYQDLLVQPKEEVKKITQLTSAKFETDSTITSNLLARRTLNPFEGPYKIKYNS
ncbi:MAG TPA: hypothetical protein DCE52_02430, partial [Rhodobacteraceae bacterium]|nr:hypothetical protein [Paracoccaceae bacterium]